MKQGKWIQDEERSGKFVSTGAFNNQIFNTLGKIVSRTCTARLEFHPEYPRRTTSAYVMTLCDKLNSLTIIMHPTKADHIQL